MGPEGEIELSERMRKSGVITLVALIVVMVWRPTGTLASQSGEAATPAASPSAEIVVDQASARFPVAGNAFHLLEPGILGELSLVAHGVITGAAEGPVDIPVIVRNNTDQIQESVTVGAEARDASGNLLGASQRSIQTLSLPIVEPGALAIGNVRFEASLPEGATVTFYPPEGGGDVDYALRVYEGRSGVELTEFSAAPERVIGTVRSTADAPVNTVELHLACFNASGTLVEVIFLKPARENLRPGESTAFADRTQGSCDSYLVTGEGFHS